MADWPTTLPQRLMIDGYKEKPRIRYQSFKPDVGPDQRFNKYTRRHTEVSGSMMLTLAQNAILDEFYYEVLNGGTLEFNWTDMIRGNIAGFTFMHAPTKEPPDHGHVLVKMQLLRRTL